MVLNILTGYGMLSIVSLDQLTGACHTHTFILSRHSGKVCTVHYGNSWINHFSYPWIHSKVNYNREIITKKKIKIWTTVPWNEKPVCYQFTIWYSSIWMDCMGLLKFSLAIKLCAFYCGTTVTSPSFSVFQRNFWLLFNFHLLFNFVILAA